jgi:hypothetical protein
MRVQLRRQIARVRAERARGSLAEGVQLCCQLAVLLATVSVAHADGELMSRGVYYKEKATRVIQPMLDGMFDVGTRGQLDAHLLVDAITSASASSGTADAKPFTEKRYEAGARYTHELDGPVGSMVDLFRVSGESKFSTESDYRSIYFGGRGEAELAQKNAVVGIGGGVSIDRVDNSGAQGALGGPDLLCEDGKMAKSCPLRTYLASASASQIVSQNALVAATYDVIKMDGFQSNAYRQVVTSGGFFPEKHPYSRLRQAVAVSARYYYPLTETAIVLAYRFYHDDWKINAHTPEIRLVQQVGLSADATFRYRYYTQSAAYFAPSAYMGNRYPDPTMTSVPYLTDDPKMTAYDGHILEAKLGILGQAFDLSDRWGRARFEGILEYIVQNNRFGNAVEAHVAVSVPFDY